jgi:radical SAM protein with 4Fe4S-binding SPASM domain
VPLCLISDEKRKSKHLRVGSLCAAAKVDGFFVIDPSGYIRACNHSPKRLGYIFDDDIIAEKDYWKMFADRTYGLPDMCTDCEFIEKCDCGCREAASICYGNLSAPDPCITREESII